MVSVREVAERARAWVWLPRYMINKVVFTTGCQRALCFGEIFLKLFFDWFSRIGSFLSLSFSTLVAVFVTTGLLGWCIQSKVDWLSR